MADELAPGLRRWTAFHPDWNDDVASLAVETGDGLVLIDPLEPPREVERPAHVLLTVFWYLRSTPRLTGARVWAPSRSARPVENRGVTVSDRFRPGDDLPGGIAAHATARATEVVLWLPEQRALVVGDVLLGGPLRLCPETWLGTRTRADLAASLRPLLELPIRMVLTSHGEPELASGRSALERALGEP